MRHGPFRGSLDVERMAAYAATTGATKTAVLEGRADLPADIWSRIHGGVHGEHGLLHRALRPGESLDTWAELSAIRTVRAGTKAVVHFEQVAADGRLAAEHPFAHGLCTMAMCTHRVLDTVGVDDPALVSRVAVRFAFDAHCADAQVISHGRLELRS